MLTSLKIAICLFTRQNPQAFTIFNYNSEINRLGPTLVHRSKSNLMLNKRHKFKNKYNSKRLINQSKISMQLFSLNL